MSHGAQKLDFICNVCGTCNTGVERFGREVPSCSGCRSSVRIRSLLYALSMELFGAPLTVPEFPVLKGLRGAGMTDSESYAQQLAAKFDYRNTYFDREPHLDITELDSRLDGTLDFLISSEVFEHVKPPVEAAFANAFRFLQPSGALIMTVPYAPAGAAVEHFPDFNDAGIVQLRGGPVLVNRTASGEIQIYENLVFHGGHGSTLEMRVLTEAELRRTLTAAGFSEVHFYTENYDPFGVCHKETWSLPFAARKQPFTFSPPVRADIMRQFAACRQEAAKAAASLEEHLVKEYAELYASFQERTAWAQGLDADLGEARQSISQLQAELDSRTTWALELERQLEEATQSAAAAQAEVETRTKWAQDLDRSFQERTEWAQQLNKRVEELERELKTLRAAKWSRLGRALRFTK